MGAIFTEPFPPARHGTNAVVSLNLQNYGPHQPTCSESQALSGGGGAHSDGFCDPGAGHLVGVGEEGVVGGGDKTGMRFPRLSTTTKGFNLRENSKGGGEWPFASEGD